MKKQPSRFSYYRFMRQAYGPLLLSCDAGRHEDDIMVGEYSEGGGCKWEFCITQPLSDAVRVEMFRDSVRALKEPQVLAALIEMDSAHTLDEAEAILERHGILDGSDVARGETHPYEQERRIKGVAVELFEVVEAFVDAYDKKTNLKSIANAGRDVIRKAESK